MAYDKWFADWLNKPATGTPVTEGFLEHIETGVYDFSIVAENAFNLATAAETPAGAQAKADIAKARSNHTGTQTADTITDGTANKSMTAAERTKLAGVATGATVNASDASLRDRATHTGTQSADTIVNGTANKVLTAADATKLTNLNANATQGLVMRVYDAITFWPVRGTLPAGTVVCWKNSVNTTPPSIGGTGAVDGVDIQLIVSA